MTVQAITKFKAYGLRSTLILELRRETSDPKKCRLILLMQLHSRGNFSRMYCSWSWAILLCQLIRLRTANRHLISNETLIMMKTVTYSKLWFRVLIKFLLIFV